jgi:7-cyano-7-deazaguanine reductase
MSTDSLLHDAPLGKISANISEYNCELLYPIPRLNNRVELGIFGELPFYGHDVWNAFEVSWLNAQGKPIIAWAELIIPCESSHIVESKSLKLYLNSFNNSSFASFAAVQKIITRDLSEAVHAQVQVSLKPLIELPHTLLSHFQGTCLDDADVACDTYMTEPNFLTTVAGLVTETLYSDLFRANCPVTSQPDWASVFIHYTGQKIPHASLLKYLVSFRNHNEFHEQCVERIFMDLTNRCQPQALTVYARFSRRGGLDINPYRSTTPTDKIDNVRLARQ